MFASIFQIIIVKPIFNLLVFIYAILPGHNFGLALIIFTIVIRLLMWPLIKKQLHQAKAMRDLQPEIKKVKQAAAGNRQKESQLLMELYKEKEINPFGSIGTLIIQFIILIGLYSGLRSVVAHPEAIITNSYSWIRNFSWMKELASNIHRFDASLLGLVDLTKAALKAKGGIYWPAMVIVVASAITQYFSSKQLLPSSKDSKGLKGILKDAGKGKQADQTEVSAAVGRSTRYFIPVLIFFFTVSIASALSLYWFVGGLIAFLQQGYILRRDESEMEKSVSTSSGSTDRTVVASEVVSATKPKPSQSKKNKKNSSRSKRRKK
ncbi:MAG TPA: YidC/Oxa1 family membrane protein insertase [Candidatus Saccharimonadales bacterium]|nr:YidC/Oxa1 family membrane protein insertase [Candidatus Saccharimonadales bacterium]